VVTSQGCTASGLGEVKTEVFAYNLVSSNGDQKNDNFRIDCISQFPNNNVKIFNRSGVLVYEADGYDNNDVVFTGVGEKGVYTIGNQLPVGTYFYIIDKRDGSKPKTGYLELVN
jgi:gliding motility-associated-like protein